MFAMLVNLSDLLEKANQILNYYRENPEKLSFFVHSIGIVVRYVFEEDRVAIRSYI